MQVDRALDLTNLETAFEDDQEGIAEILEMALADTLERAIALEAALAGSDFASAQQYAHAIKGAAANVGAFQLSQAAGAIESAVRENDFSSAALHFAAIAPAIGRFELAVNAYRSSL